MKLEEKTLESKKIFKGRVIDVDLDKIELPNGKISSREVVNHPGGVCIAALTDKNELLFVKQYRYPYHKVILELPAGKLEKDANPLENGKRELREETGAIGKDYISLGKLYPSPGYCGEIIHLYACKVESFGDTDPDDDEFLDIIKIDINEAVKMVLENRICDSKTQVAILKLHALCQQSKF